MARIVFFNVPAFGHTNPTLPLVRELTARGHEVHYYSVIDFKEPIAATGAVFHAYNPDHCPEYKNLSENVFQVAFDLLRMTDMLMPAMIDEISRLKPDLLMYDASCGWGRCISRMTNIPHICSNTTFAFNPFMLFTNPGALANSAGEAIESAELVARFSQLAWKIFRTYGVMFWLPVEMYMLHGAENIVYTSAYFQPASAFFGKNFHFIGPSIFEPPKPAGEGDAASPGAPTVFISLGTLYNAKPGFYRTCFEAFADDGRKYIMSVGKRLDIRSLEPIPKNFKVVAYAPQLEILRHASLFITHGGMNSVSEAFYYGVPVLVIPQTADQPHVAHRVTTLQAGLTLRPDQVTAASLRNFATKIIRDPRFREQAKKIGGTLKKAGGYAKGAALVEKILSKSLQYSLV